MSADHAYLDSSAFVKLSIPEAESAALREYLRGWAKSASSALLRTESMRALRPHGQEAVRAARAHLEDVLLVDVDTAVLELAGIIGPEVLRSLDAIHLATAQLLGSDLGVIVTYDRRLAAAAGELGLPVASPA
ncbi:MAG TPA: type II toxin-antitoxin system VapC family toxin [Chloroflexota bacterium]|nr:type II toxin-antitoxin system VapC family toxin [Chloroflexota bacterium]